MAKIGSHIKQGSRNGYGSLAESKQSIVLSCDDGGVLLETKQKSGNHTITIFRDTSIYLEAPPNFDSSGDMVALARQWYPSLKAKWAQNPADFYTMTNEIGANDVSAIQKLVAYERELMNLANADGIKVCVLNLATGSPGDFNVWKQYHAPFIIEAWSKGNIYGRHVYGDGDLIDANGNVIPGNPSRPFEEISYLNSLGKTGGVALTEVGLDGGFNFPGVDRFVRQATLYEQKIRNIPEIIGACYWVLGNWSPPANWQDAIPNMTQYNLQNPTAKWVVPSVPPQQTLNQYLWQESKSFATTYGINYNPVLGLWKRIRDDGYLPVHTEITRTYGSTVYAIQQAHKEGANRRLYIYTSGQPIVWTEETTVPPIPPVNRPVGVDVSHHQGVMNWAKCKQNGAWYAFIKATQRLNYVDPQFITNRIGAKAAGLITGAYHYFQPEYDPILQAQHFVNVAGGSVDLPLVLDVEEQGTYPNFLNRVKACLQKIRELTGRKPILYTSNYYMKYYLTGITTSEVDLWIANWTSNSNPTVPTGWNWVFWQYTNDPSGQYGYNYGAQSPRIDLNRFNGTLQALYDYVDAQPVSNKLNLVPYFTPTNGSKGDIVTLQNNWGQGNERQQLQQEGNNLYVTKNSQYEKRVLSATTIDLVLDTSPGNDQYYTVSGTWLPKEMEIGQSFTRTEIVKVFNKPNCSLVDNYTSTSSIKLVAHYPTLTPANGIAVQDVIELHWILSNGTVEERYFFAKGKGLIQWIKKDGRRSWVIEVIPQGQQEDNVREVINCL